MGTHPQGSYKKRRFRCVQLVRAAVRRNNTNKAFESTPPPLFSIYLLLNNPQCSGSRATAERVSLMTSTSSWCSSYLFTIKAPTTCLQKLDTLPTTKCFTANDHTQRKIVVLGLWRWTNLLSAPLCPPTCSYDSTLPLNQSARTNVPMLPAKLGPQNTCESAKGRRNKCMDTYSSPSTQNESRARLLNRSLAKPSLLTSVH